MRVMTYRELLVEGCRALAKAEIVDGAGDAKALLLAAAQFDASDFILNEDSKTPQDVIARFDGFIKRRIERQPVSLILGSVDFFGLTFQTDKRALAPRFDSETLVAAALEVSESADRGKIVDLGVGSGCLILSFLANRPNWTGTALDKSSDALSLAKENADRLGLTGQITFLDGEWPVAATEISHADIVISNPPYIKTAVLSSLEPEVTDHDPLIALDGGADGLDAYRSIIDLVSNVGRPGLNLLFEIGFDQGEDLKALFLENNFKGFTVLNDFSGHNRVVHAILQ